MQDGLHPRDITRQQHLDVPAGRAVSAPAVLEKVAHRLPLGRRAAEILQLLTLLISLVGAIRVLIVNSKLSRLIQIVDVAAAGVR